MTIALNELWPGMAAPTLFTDTADAPIVHALLTWLPK
jgi:hypothetical protein